MMLQSITPATDVDPDVVQAISDFRGIVERINTNGLRVVKHAVGSHPRRQIETQIGSDMELLRTRAERLGDGWTALDSARLEYEAATSARMAAEHAARHFETRRVTR